MLLGNKRHRDAHATPTNQTENEEVVKRPAPERKEAEVPKGGGDESFYYDLEAALEDD